MDHNQISEDHRTIHTSSLRVDMPNHDPPSSPPTHQRIIVHFDADCFYAQCEELRDPSLALRPLAITQKFLCVTSNHIARNRYGVTKLMSIKDAQRACPSLVLINGEDLTPYRRKSKEMIQVLKQYGTVQKLGLDEVYVDITDRVMQRYKGSSSSGSSNVGVMVGKLHIPLSTVGLTSLRQDNPHRPQDLRAISNQNNTQETHYTPSPFMCAATRVAAEARETIKQQTGLRVSAGIATNKLISKLISGLHKPNNQTLLLPLHYAAFVAPLPIRAIPGIGHKTEAEMKEVGIEYVHQALEWSEEELIVKFGGRVGGWVAAARWGLDPSPVVDNTGPQKTITVEDSFRNCSGFESVGRVLCVLAPDLWARLEEDEEEYGRRATKLVVKWRLRGGGSRSSASTMFPGGKNHLRTIQEKEQEVVAAALDLLKKNIQEPFDLTLINIGATNFVDNARTRMGVPTVGATMGHTRSTAAVGGLPHVIQGMMTPREYAEHAAKQRRHYAGGGGVGGGRTEDVNVSPSVVLSKRDERTLRELSEDKENNDGDGLHDGIETADCAHDNEDCDDDNYNGNGEREGVGEEDVTLWHDLVDISGVHAFVSGVGGKKARTVMTTMDDKTVNVKSVLPVLNAQTQTQKECPASKKKVAATYLNAEALAVQQLFQPKIHGVSDDAHAPEQQTTYMGMSEEERAGWELAMKLQREEAVGAAAATANTADRSGQKKKKKMISGQGNKLLIASPNNNRQKQLGPLDGFLVRKKPRS